MKLILSELHKLFSSRAVAIFLVILLLVNFSLTYYTSRPLPVEDAAREVYELYLNDPLALTEYKEQLEADFLEHIRDDDFEIPSSYTAGADDMSVLNRVFERAEYIRNFHQNTEKIVTSANRRIQELGYFGYSADSFFIREQNALSRVYTDLSDALNGENEYAYGYDAYFENSTVCLFILLWLLWAVSFIFRNDSICGFGCIMRTSKCGRIDSALAKIAATVIVSISVTIIFLVTTFIAVGLANSGFSSILAPIQLLPNYAKVPFEISILGYLGIQTGYRLLASSVFALFVALVASLGLNYVFCFGIGATFAACNYFIFTYDYLGTIPSIKYLNIASAAEGIELFSFHRDLNLLGNPISYIVILIAICVISLVLLSSLCAFFYCKNIKISFPKKLDLKSVINKTSTRGSKHELRLSPLFPLWIYELKKNRFIPLMLIVLALLAAHCGFVSNSIGTGETYGEAIYYGYIAEIKELSPENRRSYLAEERALLESIISNYEPMTKAYELAEVTQDEYSRFLQEYYKAKDHEKVLANVEDYSKYIDRKGCDMIYNTGYEHFFALKVNWFLFTALVILSIGIFSVEYQSGNCAQIIKTAKKGRKSTFFSKVLPYTFIGAILGGVFRVVGIGVTALNYELSDLSATLCSIRVFEAVESDITIRSYLIIDLACSVFAGALLGCTICLISSIFKKTLYSLGAVGVGLAVPALLSNTEISLVNLTAPQTLYCSSFNAGVEWQKQYFMAIIMLHLLIVLCLALFALHNYGVKLLIGQGAKHEVNNSKCL